MNRLFCAMLSSALLLPFWIWPARAMSTAGTSAGQSQLGPVIVKFDTVRNHVNTFNSKDHTRGIRIRR